MTFSLATLIVFYKDYKGHTGTNNSKFDEVVYTVHDDSEILSFFHELNMKSDNDLNVMVREILGNKTLWDRDLNEIDGLHKNIVDYCSSIVQNGMKVAIEELSNLKLINYLNT